MIIDILVDTIKDTLNFILYVCVWLCSPLIYVMFYVYGLILRIEINIMILHGMFDEYLDKGYDTLPDKTESLKECHNRFWLL